MRFAFKLLTGLLLFASTKSATAQLRAQPFFDLPDSMQIEGKLFSRTLSIHPTPFYYQVVYTPPGEHQTHYRHAFILEASVNSADVQATVTTQMQRMEERKASDPHADYELLSAPDTGEKMLSFTQSESNINGKTGLLEWNVCRYIPFTDTNGNRGTITMVLSVREYDKVAAQTLKQWEQLKANRVHMLASMPIPAFSPRVEK